MTTFPSQMLTLKWFLVPYTNYIWAIRELELEFIKKLWFICSFICSGIKTNSYYVATMDQILHLILTLQWNDFTIVSKIVHHLVGEPRKTQQLQYTSDSQSLAYITFICDFFVKNSSVVCEATDSWATSWRFLFSWWVQWPENLYFQQIPRW